MQSNLERNKRIKFLNQSASKNEINPYDSIDNDARPKHHNSIDYRNHSFSDFPTILPRSSQGITPIMSGRGNKSV